MSNIRSFNLFLCALFLLTFSHSNLIQAQEAHHPKIENFVYLALADNQDKLVNVLEEIGNDWQDGYTPMLLEVLTFVRNPVQYGHIMNFLREHTGKDFGYDPNAWFEWVWSLDYKPHPEYAKFKST